MSAKRLLVCGGTGFLGRKICETAVAHGWNVTSLSRSGYLRVPNGPLPAWTSKVRFERFDQLRSSPEELDEFLKDSTAIVYCLGNLFESKYYKSVVSSGSILEGVQDMFKNFNRNPLKYEIEETSYKSMNRDLAIKLGEEASKFENIKAFVYTSAASRFPLVPKEYFETKKQAEEALSTISSFRSIFIRPGFMYDVSRPMSLYIKTGLGAVGQVNNMLGGNAPLISEKALEPISTSIVAAGTIQALDDETISGVLNREDLVELAKTASQKA
ncbi:hypothetical protein V1511DRAFT_509679 [Dipodascopsis uninucleata]